MQKRCQPFVQRLIFGMVNHIKNIIFVSWVQEQTMKLNQLMRMLCIFVNLRDAMQWMSKVCVFVSFPSTHDHHLLTLFFCIAIAGMMRRECRFDDAELNRVVGLSAKHFEEVEIDQDDDADDDDVELSATGEMTIMMISN